MLSRIKKLHQEGFTIIEVLIVLAIAALILLIVFLAVPALQRSARDTSRKADASSMLAAVSDYEDNNNGTPPSKIDTTANTGTFNLCVASPCGTTESPAQFKLGYYSKANTTGPGAFELLNVVKVPTNTDELFIELGVTCSGNTPTTTGAGARSVAAVYSIESGGKLTTQCTAS